MPFELRINNRETFLPDNSFIVLLDQEFYQRKNVTRIARDLLGKILYSKIEGVITSGVIVETEAYSWKERGCHAYGKKLTQRTEVMFRSGGCAYVYFCYGMHNMFNIVTNQEGIPEAVLIRAIEPLQGMETMQKRRGVKVSKINLTSGPGKLTKAMGINRSFNGKDLSNNEIWVEMGEVITPRNVITSTRIGIDYAGEDANLPWRYTLKDNVWISKRPSRL